MRMCPAFPLAVRRSSVGPRRLATPIRMLTTPMVPQAPLMTGAGALAAREGPGMMRPGGRVPPLAPRQAHHRDFYSREIAEAEKEKLERHHQRIAQLTSRRSESAGEAKPPALAGPPLRTARSAESRRRRRCRAVAGWGRGARGAGVVAHRGEGRGRSGRRGEASGRRRCDTWGCAQKAGEVLKPDRLPSIFHGRPSARPMAPEPVPCAAAACRRWACRADFPAALCSRIP